MDNVDSTEYLSIVDIMKILRKKIVFIILLTGICTSIMMIKVAFLTKPIYMASTTAVIVKGDTSVVKSSHKAQYYTENDISLYQKMVDTYVQIAQSNLVLSKSAQELGTYQAAELSKMITAAPISTSSGETQIIKLTAVSSNKNDVANIANIYCKNFINESMNILPVGEIKVLDSAETPDSPIPQNKLMNIGVGFLFGLILSVGIVLFKNYIYSLKISNEKQVNDLLNIPVLVTVE
ncbi:YveK family protein [Clostridium oryzae]|uniref:Capsular polysaccharide type 8 biosynthesis protein cap8A n=1 Tax=Clostridium oryzae TaxID=1450648 RepID=A0A1V4IRZ4_9CLOT|nr:GNVR domain-containing protein [Clostridium oryzae]OPJ62696.1 capsular polysaccharide type 8 biosynthesis protein cap8A [Clostridium oryzae]